jgi:hypothetical protein
MVRLLLNDERYGMWYEVTVVFLGGGENRSKKKFQSSQSVRKELKPAPPELQSEALSESSESPY